MRTTPLRGTRPQRRLLVLSHTAADWMSRLVDQRASATSRKRRIIVSSVAFISMMPARTSATGSPLSRRELICCVEQALARPLVVLPPMVGRFVGEDVEAGGLGRRPMIRDLRRPPDGWLW